MEHRLRYYAFSFLLHLLLFLTALIPKKSAEPEVIEMTILDSPSKFSRVVDTKRVNDETDDNAKFLGDHNQKVRKQKTAKNFNIERFLPKFDVTKSVPIREEKDPYVLEETRQKPENFSKNLDYIDNLDPDLQTELSTKEFVFYTFFARIRERLSPYWVSLLRSKLKLVKHARHIVTTVDGPTRDLTTRCLITLDKDGRLIKVQIVMASGSREYDEAAVEAIKQATPFLNPPKGMRDADGNIRILWDFIFRK